MQKIKKNNWSIWWLAGGIILSTATQLRLQTLPIGPGELMLCIWIFSSALTMLRKKTPRINWSPISKLFLIFWSVTFILLIFGFTFAFMLEISPPNVIHDTFAFGLIAVLCFFITTREDSTYYLPLISKYILVSSVSFLCLLLILAWLDYPSLGSIDTFWMGSRFIGWSENPNQIGMIVCGAPFLAIYWVRRSRTVFKKLLYTFLILASIAIGLASLSDSFKISFLTGVFTLIISIIVFSFQQHQKAKATIKLILFISVVFIFSFVIFYIYNPISDITMWFRYIYEVEGYQGRVRLLLWYEAMKMVAISPIFGLGPGAHSNYNYLMNMEAHNTYLDWSTNTGILGGVFYISLLIKLGKQAWKNKNAFLLALLVAFSTFSMFNYVLRHPFFWFNLITISTINFNESAISGKFPAIPTRRSDHRTAWTPIYSKRATRHVV